MKILIYLQSIIWIHICFCKPPMVIPPQNPNDPINLPKGVTKNVLIIGENKQSFLIKKKF